jgi:uncharacterized protein YsxB (DUF464 family)
MTKVVIEKKNGHIVSLSADGHTGYGVEGEDIVCAALSSVIQTALLGLMRVAGISVEYTVLETEGSLEFSLPTKLSERDRNNADMILETMLCGIADLHEGYSDFIELEVK